MDNNWEGIEFPAGIKDWKRFEKNNKTIALNILSVPHDEKTINLEYKSKYNCKRKNQVVLLMIAMVKKRHYIAKKFNMLMMDLIILQKVCLNNSEE